jgi:CRISPR/Cas system CSM-associated protein Csm3 (group 7 of RAMP superfamily)
MLNIFDGDDDAKLTALVEEGLRLVACDALGGQSSRGYGRVEIALTQLAQIPIHAFTSDENLNASLAGGKLDPPRIWSDLGQKAA